MEYVPFLFVGSVENCLEIVKDCWKATRIALLLAIIERLVKRSVVVLPCPLQFVATLGLVCIYYRCSKYSMQCFSQLGTSKYVHNNLTKF